MHSTIEAATIVWAKGFAGIGLEVTMTVTVKDTSSGKYDRYPSVAAEQRVLRAVLDAGLAAVPKQLTWEDLDMDKA